ncbi:lachesin-like isoform X2 [Vespa crabro]|uniref:lachesin-like isoform X2 n=1 Tax=Vespa crabro TaxID=7445 RepID=UPI001F027DCD|nr:lachesin-like isoform X2 [Vespa crabro]
MRVAQLLLWCVLLEDYGGNLGRAAITSDSIRQDAASASAPASAPISASASASAAAAAAAAVSSSSSATNPTLPEAIGNVTAAIGKEAILSCTIRKLGNYKVGWLRVEDQTILSMGQRTVTHSARFLVTMEKAKAKNQTHSREDEEATWSLHIRQLRKADRGCYMCQINAQPMLSQLGCVDVLVPPDILSSGTSEGEVSVLEGENATLSCKASGRPAPRVLWKREKSDFILMRGLHETLIQVDSQSGEKLELTRVDRRQMGAYLCIARNEVPPTVSKRVYLRVNFAPIAKVRNQLLGSPLDTDVSLICSIEAYPKTINLWTRKEQVIMSGGRYEIDERSQPEEEWKTTIELKIKRLQKTDLGEYTCSASSSMGKAEATIRVYEIERATLPTRATSPTWRKQNKGGKSKSILGVSTVNRVFHQLSTPAMQKSTSRLIFGNKYSTTSTTVDPRGSSSIVVKGNNGYTDEKKSESKKEPKVENVANIGNFIFNKQIYTICLTFLSTIR